MAKKDVKVLNMIDSSVTVNLKDFSDRVITIKAKGFGMLSEDELAYVMSNSQVFKKGTLSVSENSKEKLSDNIHKEELESPNALTAKEISNLLRRSQRNLKAGLEEIDSIQTLKRILDYAKESDKSIKVIEIINSRLEKLME